MDAVPEIFDWAGSHDASGCPAQEFDVVFVDVVSQDVDEGGMPSSSFEEEVVGFACGLDVYGYDVAGIGVH